ncbi:hypothetical protein Q3G72_031317 [Acer saccharum]|nr:hypothetical protein Q3G72_031317 [Acer saccharum]
MNLKVGCVDVTTSKRKIGIKWRPPLDRFLKFNIDGSLRGNPGPSGIGGILRNNDGDTLCIFSSFIGCGISPAAKVEAILKACQLCVLDKCPTDVKVIIESDSKAAVSWVNGVGGVGNVRFLDSIMEIKDILFRCKPNLVVQYVPKSGNDAADFLAKQGALSGLVQVAWAG